MHAIYARNNAARHDACPDHDNDTVMMTLYVTKHGNGWLPLTSLIVAARGRTRVVHAGGVIFGSGEPAQARHQFAEPPARGWATLEANHGCACFVSSPGKAAVVSSADVTVAVDPPAAADFQRLVRHALCALGCALTLAHVRIRTVDAEALAVGNSCFE